MSAYASNTESLRGAKSDNQDDTDFSPRSQIISILTQEELDIQLKSAENKLVILKFCEKWCAPSLMIAPIFENLSEAHRNSVFIEIMAGQAEKLSKQYNISYLPTFYFYRNECKLDEIIGANEKKLRKLIEKHEYKFEN